MMTRFSKYKFPRAIAKVAMSALLLSACIGVSPAPVPTATPAPESQSPAETTAPPATTGDSQLSGTLDGTVTYVQRVALPAGSVIEVQLQDVSRADAPAQVIASQTITTSGENVPIPFSLSYDPAQIDERFTYALGVRITVDGQLRWINTEHYAVLTRGAPTSAVEVVVQSVQ